MLVLNVMPVMLVHIESSSWHCLCIVNGPFLTIKMSKPKHHNRLSHAHSYHYHSPVLVHLHTLVYSD